MERAENIVQKEENHRKCYFSTFCHHNYNFNTFKSYTLNPVLTLSQTNPGFYVSAVQVFENTVEKVEIACNEQLLLFLSVFYPFGELCTIFIKFDIVVCKFFQLRRF